ncbi:MAG: hypothetical protein WAT66_08635 [Actinomycetota bacterium]
MTRFLIGTESSLIEIGSDDTLLSKPTALARGSDGWWSIAERYRVMRSPDARAWEEVEAVHGLRANCVLPHDGGALVGTSEAHLVLVAGGTTKHITSFDQVPSREDWYTPWGGPADVRSLSRGPDGAAYANVHVGGILRSDDGETWRATSMDINADVHQVLAHPETPGLVFAATAVGLATSTDGGETWDFSEDGMHASYCRAVAIAGDTLLVSASKSHTGRQSGLYRRPLMGGAFERCEKGLPDWFADNVDTFCLDARGDVAILGTKDGLVFVSDDAGVTWHEEASGLPSVTCVAIS